ncbi:glycosyltransferase family 4 protein [Lysinibacillus parviboronicapiens]|uniref:glycosyltransferase family 4 protein n=1 Tax=Lysinibacillus parviboronicapiens TaxID=436516 RepID=UPI000D35B066|nr:glycosyltransferase family 4 protein [Lysinibacillus parviboronicapiens]
MRVVLMRSNPVSPDPRVEKEALSLVSNNWRVQILAWDRDAKYRANEQLLEHTHTINITRFGVPATYGGGFKKNFFPLLKFQLKLLQWLLRHKNTYDTIHACDFDTALVGTICGKLLHKKVIYDVFDSVTAPFNGPETLGKIVEKIDIMLMNSVDAVIICTEKRKEQIAKSSPKKLEVIYNTPHYVKLEHDLKLNADKVKIVYVGILARERLIRELVEVVMDTPNYELHIGGFGEFADELAQMAKEHDNIVFYGKLPYEKTLALENNCDIMTAIYDPKLTNHFYAAPNKFYEALMLGKPLIMAKNTGMSEVVAENNLGELIDFNRESLRQAIDSLVKRKQEWPEIARKMKELYEERYSWSQMEKRLTDLYSSL